MKKLIASAAFAALAVSAHAQSLPNPSNPSNFDCAAIMGLVAASYEGEGINNTESQAAMAAFENFAVKAMESGGYANEDAAFEAIFARMEELLNAFGTPEGEAAIGGAMETCLTR